MVKWEDKYSVGYEKIDIQHKGLLNIINEVEKLLKNKSISEKKLYIEVSELLTELIDYTEVHFETEEKAFELSNYSYKEEHKKIHNEFFMKATDFLRDIVLDDDIRSLIQNMYNYLKDWLLNHINGEDQKYIGKLDKGLIQ